MRDGEGRSLSEFVDESVGGLTLARDFVDGVGQLVERQVTSAPPQMMLGSPLVSGGNHHLTVSDGSGAPSYELDIRSASGFQNRLTGLQPDAGQQLHAPESALSPGETNVLRRRAEGEPGTGCSVPVSLLCDPGVTPSSPNRIRAPGVSRHGTDLVLRWALPTENGKQTRMSFSPQDSTCTAPRRCRSTPRDQSWGPAARRTASRSASREKATGDSISACSRAGCPLDSPPTRSPSGVPPVPRSTT